MWRPAISLYTRVRMLIGVASHATGHESSANRRKNLEIYEKETLHAVVENVYYVLARMQCLRARLFVLAQGSL